MRSKVSTVDAVCGLVALLLVLGAVYAICRFAAWQRTRAEFTGRLAAQRANDLTTVSRHLDRLRAMLDARRSEAEDLNRRIPPAGHIGTFIEKLDGLARSHAIALVSLKALPPLAHDVYMRTPVRLVFTGAFTNVYDLFLDLEGFERVVEVEDTALTRVPETGLCRGEMTINVFEQCP